MVGTGVRGRTVVDVVVVGESEFFQLVVGGGIKSRSAKGSNMGSLTVLMSDAESLPSYSSLLSTFTGYERNKAVVFRDGLLYAVSFLPLG